MLSKKKNREDQVVFGEVRFAPQDGTLASVRLFHENDIIGVMKHAMIDKLYNEHGPKRHCKWFCIVSGEKDKSKKFKKVQIYTIASYPSALRDGSSHRERQNCASHRVAYKKKTRVTKQETKINRKKKRKIMAIAEGDRVVPYTSTQNQQ